MSTKEYLEGLSYEQLLSIHERASDMIRYIADQDSVTIWEVQGMDKWRYFREDDLHLAREQLIVELQKDSYCKQLKEFTASHPKIVKLRIRVDELKGFGL